MVLTRHDLVSSLPALDGSINLPGLTSSVEIWRDPDGIPHANAATAADAFFAQGFVHAQDRLWHMEYDRRRAEGRWAEYAGQGRSPRTSTFAASGSAQARAWITRP
jgi:penicillin amidase